MIRLLKILEAEFRNLLSKIVLSKASFDLTLFSIAFIVLCQLLKEENVDCICLNSIILIL